VVLCHARAFTKSWRDSQRSNGELPARDKGRRGLLDVMSSTAARDHGLRRVTGLTAWLGARALAATGLFAGLASRGTYRAATATSVQSTVNAVGSTSQSADGFAAGTAPAATSHRSHVTSGAS
jgi:hypothetical protein